MATISIFFFCSPHLLFYCRLQFLGKASITITAIQIHSWNMIRFERAPSGSHTSMPGKRSHSSRWFFIFLLLWIVSVEFARRYKMTCGEYNERTNARAFAVRLLDVSFKLQCVNNRIAYTQSLTHSFSCALSFRFVVSTITFCAWQKENSSAENQSMRCDQLRVYERETPKICTFFIHKSSVCDALGESVAVRSFGFLLSATSPQAQCTSLLYLFIYLNIVHSFLHSHAFMMFGSAYTTILLVCQSMCASRNKKKRRKCQRNNNNNNQTAVTRTIRTRVTRFAHTSYI